MNRSVNALIAGAFAHRVAETFYDLTMPLLVLQLTGSATLMALMFALGYAAEFLVSVFGGSIIDRSDRRRMLITVAAAELTAMSGAGTAYALGAMNVPLLIALAFVIDGLVRLSLIADSSVLPQLVDREQLPRATGRLQMALSTAQACGPAAAGACIALTGLGGSLWITAAAFLPLLWLVCLVQWPQTPRTTAPATGVAGFLASSWEGLRFTFSNPTYRALLLWRGTFDFAYGGVYLMLIFYFQHQRHLPGAEIGLIATCGALGGLLGGAGFARIQERIRSGTLLLGAAFVMAAASALLPTTGQWPLLGLLLAVMMFHGALVGRLTGLLFQSTVPAELLGRVYATTQLISTATGPISVLLAGWTAEHYGAGTVFYAGAGVVALLVILSLRSRIGRADWGIQQQQPARPEPPARTEAPPPPPTQTALEAPAWGTRQNPPPPPAPPPLYPPAGPANTQTQHPRCQHPPRKTHTAGTDPPSGAARLAQDPGVVDQRPAVPGQVRSQRRQGNGRSLALPAHIGQRQREEGVHRVGQTHRRFVQGRRIHRPLGQEQLDALARMPQIPQRAGQLNHRTAPTIPGQSRIKGPAIQHRGLPGELRGIVRGSQLEIRHRVPRRKLVRQGLDPAPEILGPMVVDGVPQHGDALLPLPGRGGDRHAYLANRSHAREAGPVAVPPPVRPVHGPHVYAGIQQRLAVPQSLSQAPPAVKPRRRAPPVPAVVPGRVGGSRPR